jgi:hypothetical protein
MRPDQALLQSGPLLDGDAGRGQSTEARSIPVDRGIGVSKLVNDGTSCADPCQGFASELDLRAMPGDGHELPGGRRRGADLNNSAAGFVCQGGHGAVLRGGAEADLRRGIWTEMTRARGRS